MSRINIRPAFTPFIKRQDPHMEKVFPGLEQEGGGGGDLSIRMLLCKRINNRIHGVLSVKQQSTCCLFISSFSTSNCLHSSALSHLEAITLPTLKKTPHHKTNKSQDIRSNIRRFVYSPLLGRSVCLLLGVCVIKLRSAAGSLSSPSLSHCGLEWSV